MGMYEDDRIRRKNAIIEIERETEFVCDNCGLEVDSPEIKVDDPCPRCDEYSLSVREDY